ncbi:hypothetical protein [Desulfofundulus thermocisternus]|uniref:hypothetical protein n=1 Tax=Desulfofundulus thermocisternus TaxID=42471 RepID=UPI001A05B8FD|nr:hypothetical protein [Desulfofundulus thermocisternus]MBE3585043.1 hypothetical protein [Thermoanaerobacter sp.]MCS5694546.1 hypothetical protein [Desulfofundulus thermocisternus]
MGLSTAIFPTLSGRAAAGNSGGYARALLRAVKTVLLAAGRGCPGRGAGVCRGLPGAPAG